MTERDDERTRRAEALLAEIDQERIGRRASLAAVLRFGDDAAARALRDLDDSIVGLGSYDAYQKLREAIERYASPTDGEPAGGATYRAGTVPPRVEVGMWLQPPNADRAWRVVGPDVCAARVSLEDGNGQDAAPLRETVSAWPLARDWTEPPTPSAPCFSNSQKDSNALASPGATAKCGACDGTGSVGDFVTARDALSGTDTDDLGLEPWQSVHVSRKCNDCNGTGAPRTSDGGGREGARMRDLAKLLRVKAAALRDEALIFAGGGRLTRRENYLFAIALTRAAGALDNDARAIEAESATQDAARKEEP